MYPFVRYAFWRKCATDIFIVVADAHIMTQNPMSQTHKCLSEKRFFRKAFLWGSLLLAECVYIFIFSRSKRLRFHNWHFAIMEKICINWWRLVIREILHTAFCKLNRKHFLLKSASPILLFAKSVKFGSFTLSLVKRRNLKGNKWTLHSTMYRNKVFDEYCPRKCITSWYLFTKCKLQYQIICRLHGLWIMT